jgi:hypothetical protein
MAKTLFIKEWSLRNSNFCVSLKLSDEKPRVWFVKYDDERHNIHFGMVSLHKEYGDVVSLIVGPIALFIARSQCRQ